MSKGQRHFISGDYRKAMSKLPALLVVFSYDGNIFRLELASDRVYEKFGCASSDNKDDDSEIYKRIVHPNDVTSLRNMLLTANMAPGEDICMDARLKAVGGHRYQWYRVTINSVAASDNASLIYVNLSNVNDLHYNNDKVKASNDKNEVLLNTILNTTQVPIFWKDSNRKFLGANEAFRKYYGFTKDSDFIGKNDEEMNWHPEPALFKNDEEEVLKGASTYMVRGKCMQGTELRDIMATKNPVYENGKIVGLVGSFMDVTETYRQERLITALNEKLNKALEAERRSNQYINDFLSRMSHEIRTPMNAIMGIAELASHKTRDPEMLDSLHKIASSCEYLLGIVNDVLDIRRIEDGNLTLIVEKTGIDDILDDVRNIILPVAEKKGVSVSIEEADIEERQFIADRKRISQILVNLLGNAVKFTDANGSVSLGISQASRGKDLVMTFTVRDTGCGISPSFMQKLFRPFTQENRDKKRFGEGSGLGLAISRRFANLMHGDISVESTEGVGSVFTVVVRVGHCKQDEEDTAAASQSKEGVRSKLCGKRILLFEDNSLNVEVAAGILGEAGIIVDSASDGFEGCDKFARVEEGYYDGILMDLQMPGCDGYEATRTIRQMDRKDAQDIPIIAMSADVFEESMRKAINMGMDSYISKPINSRQLFQILERLL
ncbi:PAS domain-containing hybrid sensor histidine kinase/response regulator [Butyrivibrio sp. MC2013]|uniref:PAS domain-containing hybrid sensor histidine kinase/response regulator n=1 Tax=Butyrivibrio sp. MC2013 TaxID=1280686 RepID=UPI0004134B6F|nr:PAS domain-containing hybrid sensor histidine kinase/response regulator [Butyrivibrio sp. MC2013]